MRGILLELPHTIPEARRTSGVGRLCCKTIFSTPARKIDSRSCSQPQHRFKSARSRIRLFQIPIPQIWIGDFCNTIAPKADKLGAARMTLSRVRQEAGKE